MKKKIIEYDEHIIQALNTLTIPIIGKNGKKFFIKDKSARGESGVQHIAKKSHRLKVRDIQSVPSILKKPAYENNDPRQPIYMNYYGIRLGKDSNTFLKIVTSPIKGKRGIEEQIVTIYPVRSIKG